MTTVAKAVEEVVKSDLRLQDAMRLGIVNNRRLANRIQKEVNGIVSHNTSLASIAVALQRLGTRVRVAEDAKYSQIFGRSRLQLRDDITILYLTGMPQLRATEGAGFCIRMQGMGTTTVLVDDDAVDRLGYKKEEVLKRLENLSVVMITSPSQIVETPGVIAQLMMALGGSGINVVEVMSSFDNTFLIVEKRDSLKAVEVVRSLIRRSRK